MEVDQLDVIVRASGVTVIALLGGMLFAGDRPCRLAPWFAPLAVGLAGFLIGNTPVPSLRLSGVLGGAAHLASGYAAVCLWWFCLASFDRTFRPRGGVLAAGLAWIALASAERGLMGPDLANTNLSWVLVSLGFGMMLHLAWRILRDFRDDLVEGRRSARVGAVLFLAAQLVAELIKEVAFGPDWRPQSVTITQNAALTLVAVWLTTLLLRPTDAAAAAVKAPPSPTPAHPPDLVEPDAVDAGLIARLRHLIDIEGVHLDPGMTLGLFVGRMGASEKTVRHLINHGLGYDHFRTFLNFHRVEEARRRLRDPAREGEKMIAVAADSGFASLASFNRVFREIEGRTPGEYRRTRDGLAAGTALPPAPSGSEELYAGF